MVKIEYNNDKIEVPTGWDDITVGHYESFYNDKPTTGRERVALVAKICKVAPDVLLEWPAEAFEIILERCAFIFKDNPAPASPVIEVDGVAYIVPVEDKLSLGAYVDADEVQKSGEAVLSNVLAIVCRPAGEAYDHEKSEVRAAMFAALPVSKVQGVLSFFLLCSDALNKRTKVFTDLAEAVALLPPNIKHLRKPGAGIKLLWNWRAAKYRVLTKLLNMRLRKLLRSYNLQGTKP